MSATENSSTPLKAPERLEKMQRLIFGRLAIVFLLLLASWWWTNSVLEQSIAVFPTRLFLFFLVSIGLTGVYHAVAFFDRNYLLQKRVQFAIDVLLITWLVWETGDIESPYVPLYIVLVCMCGFMLGKAETLAIACSSAVCFGALAFLKGQALIYSLSGDVAPGRLVQMIAFRIVSILIVGLISARIADRKRIGEQLLKSEESFADLHMLHERIVQSVDTGLITTDLDGKIYAFNRAAEEISGLKAKNVIGTSVLNVFGEAFQKRIDVCLGSVQTADFGGEHFEAQLPAGGQQVAAACSVLPLYRKSGSVSGAIVTFQDISRIRALEESLRRADRLAAVGRMAAGLAHEIRNPLGSLGSSLQFLRGRVPGDSSEAALFDVVLRESERLNGIITNFLAYARPNADALEQKETEETDIDAAIRDCLVLVRHSPKVGDAHRFTYEPSNAPVRSRISETQVKQVMWNLLQNSINAMPDGGDITVRLNEIPGGRIQMLFQDTGPGFTRDNLEHLYEPFCAAANGTGLGLSIVHKIVSDHDGRIDVGSAEGAGTKIVVELPR